MVGSRGLEASSGWGFRCGGVWGLGFIVKVGRLHSIDLLPIICLANFMQISENKLL